MTLRLLFLSRCILPAVIVCASTLTSRVSGAASPDLAAADFTPADALAFVSLPDPKRTVDGWKNSILYKAWREPEVQTFLEKPLTRVPPIPAEAATALQKFDSLGLKNAFAALLPSTDPKNPYLVAGFAFKCTPAELETVLAKPKEELKRKNPTGKAGSVTYGTHNIDTFEASGTSIASCVNGNWYFVSSDLAGLKAVLDRVDAKPGALTLSKDPTFTATAARMPPQHESLFYIAAAPVIRTLGNVLEGMGNPLPAPQRAMLENIKGFAAASAYEGGKIRDTLFFLGTPELAAPGSLSFKSLPYTSGDTLVYLTSMLRWPDEPAAVVKPDPATPGKPGTPAAPAKKDPLAEVLRAMEAAGLSLKDIRAAFPSEGSLFLDWTSGSLYPSPILCLEMRDRAAALKLVDAAIAKAGPPKDAEWKSKTEDGVDYRILTPKRPGQPISPAIAVGPSFLLAGIIEADVRAAMNRAKGTGTRVDGSAGWKAGFVDGKKPDQTLVYVDAKGIFEKVYGLARSFAPALSDNPQVQGTVELEKLPSVESIAKHLQPIVLTSRRMPDGLLIESSGPITIPHLTAGLVGTTAGIGYFAKGFAPGGGSPGKVAPKTDDEAPNSTPTSSPSPRTPKKGG